MTPGWRSELRLDGEGAVYEQIKRALMENIRSGEWPVGHRIPAEEDLAAHFDTARMTVNRALRELQINGWIVRRRGAGSFVARPPEPTALLEIVDMARSIPARGERYGYDCLLQEEVRACEETSDRLRVPVGAALRHVVCRHTADGEIVELEERWINLELLPQAAEQDFAEIGPGSWLLVAAPWTEAEHTVRAINAPEELAARLEVEPGDACLVLERRTFLGDEVVTWARLTHPGDRHAMTGRFSP